MIVTASDLKTYMALAGTAYDAILGIIADEINGDVKRYLGREAVEPTVIGDGVTSEMATGNRRTILQLREYPIQSVQSLIVNGSPFTPILPFAPGNVIVATLATGGSINPLAGGQTVYVKVTAFGPLVASSGVQATGQEGGWTSEFSVFVPFGTATNSITVQWNNVPNATYYNVYFGTTPGAENLAVKQVSPVSGWGGYANPGTETITIQQLSAGTQANGLVVQSATAPAGGPIITGGDYTIKDGGRFGQLHRDYGWDLPKASIGWSSAWWDQQGLFLNPTGQGTKVIGVAQQNIVCQYTAGYAQGGDELKAIKGAAIEWSVNRFRMRAKVEMTMEKVHDHQAWFAVDMPDFVRHVLNTYKRAGQWVHPRETVRA